MTSGETGAVPPRLPIVLIGCGGIARSAHLPAYRKAGFEVWGAADPEVQRARELAGEFGVPRSFHSAAAAIDAAPSHAVFDLAAPARAIEELLRQIPDGRAVLIQKPMGEDLRAARSILEICRQRGLKAAVNFQLRYAPVIRALGESIERGELGELNDFEIRVNVETPWHLWSFLRTAPRLEILYHSIHYLDLARFLFGEPVSIKACTARDPATPELAATRTAMILGWERPMLATIRTNHGHRFGPRHQRAFIKCEGTRGAAVATLGLLLDYPRGKPDAFEIHTGHGWEERTVAGNWMPDAFIGPMRDLMFWASGAIASHPTRVEDAMRTMALVEAAYEDNDRAGNLRGENV